MKKMMIVLAALASLSVFADDAMNTESTHSEKTEHTMNGAHKKTVKSKKKNADGSTTEMKSKEKTTPADTNTNTESGTTGTTNE